MSFLHFTGTKDGQKYARLFPKKHELLYFHWWHVFPRHVLLNENIRLTPDRGHVSSMSNPKLECRGLVGHPNGSFEFF